MPFSVWSIPSNSSKSALGKELLTTSIGWLTTSRYRTNLTAPAPKVRQNPKLNRSLRGETRAVRSSGEIPGSPRRSCGAPPVPPRARSGEQTPPAAERYHCAYSGLGVAQLVGPNCVRLGEWSVTAPARPCKPQSHPGEGCDTGSPLGFFYLEIWVRAQAPGLTSSVTQPGVVQAAADSRTGQVFQTGLLPQILLQLGQRPGCKSQSQILGMGCRHLQNLGGGSGSVIGRASRAGAIRQPFHSRCQEPAHPMRSEAASAGFYQAPWGKACPRIQLLPVADLLAGKTVDFPRENVTFKKAPRAQAEAVETDKLQFE